MESRAWAIYGHTCTHIDVQIVSVSHTHTHTHTETHMDTRRHTYTHTSVLVLRREELFCLQRREEVKVGGTPLANARRTAKKVVEDELMISQGGHSQQGT